MYMLLCLDVCHMPFATVATADTAHSAALLLLKQQALGIFSRQMAQPSPSAEAPLTPRTALAAGYHFLHSIVRFWISKSIL